MDQEKNFYFLEMNTRLQVEHPVTELVTGLDLVQLQIRIAAGEKLPFRQEEFASAGMPSSAASMRKIRTTISSPVRARSTLLLTPAGPGIRLDSGVYEGWTVPIDYDPLLAKLIGYGQDRAAGDVPAGCARWRNTSWAASRPTLGCSGGFWLMKISSPARSTPDIWSDCWIVHAGSGSEQEERMSRPSRRRYFAVLDSNVQDYRQRNAKRTPVQARQAGSERPGLKA